MNEISRTIKNYESISDDLKFLPKSLIRLKILKTLYECPMDMKQINHKTKINYSAISNTIHKLELDGYIYRENNSYFLSNSMKVCMGNLFDLDDLMILLKDISSISLNHNVHSIPVESICTFHYLNNIHLVESDGLDAYKIYSLIENSILNAHKIHAILPFSYDAFNKRFNDALSKNCLIYLLSPLDIKDMLIKNLDYSKTNLKMKFFKGVSFNYFLLICTDKKMILGFFRDDCLFDQNRILISSDGNCIKWANDLFKNFKNENIINEY